METPPNGAIKINVDANFNRDKCIAQSGIVIRDEKGVLIEGHVDSQLFPLLLQKQLQSEKL